MIQMIRKRGKLRSRKDPRHGILSRMLKIKVRWYSAAAKILLGTTHRLLERAER